METAHRDNPDQLTVDPPDVARRVIAEATEVISCTRASVPEHAAAYRRRACAWRQLARSLPYEAQRTSTMLRAAADDMSRARTLSDRRRSDALPPPR